MTQFVRSASLILAAAALLAAGGAEAHHSTAMFDMHKDVTLDGTIKRFDWTNPHTWIVFVVPNAQGGMDEYGIEGMSPNYLVRNGWSKHTLMPGDKVELTIHPLRDGRKGGFDVSVKWPDGKLMYNLPHRP
ncbi:MAG TPA: DUF6152 family protein [Steroidobacteraceae bacterium]|nr:DUF6152 family protein [Steroidobacteraceae bacterium]